MNQESAILDETGLELLEEKVGRAVELIHHLRSERSRLLEVQAGLEARLAEAGAIPASLVEELKARVAALEAERTRWLNEKRDLTRRVEGIVAKLELLESESQTH